MPFSLKLIPYQELRFDRDNPRLTNNNYHDPAAIISHLLDHTSIERLRHGFGTDADTALNPFIVIPEDDHYVVLDGNIRLAYMQLTCDDEVRALSRRKNLPPQRDDTPIVHAAVFDDRNQALPHLLRNASNNRAYTWLHQHWATALTNGLKAGFDITDMAGYARINVANLAFIVEVENAYHQIKTLHDDRWQHVTNTYKLRQAIAHHSLRRAIGLPEKTDLTFPADPLQTTEMHQTAQAGLMDLLYGREGTHEAKIRDNKDFYIMSQIHDDPAGLADYRARGARFHTLSDYHTNYLGTPTIAQARDWLHTLTYEASRELNFQTSKLDNPNLRNTITLGRVVYSTDADGNQLYQVELASKFPDLHRQLALDIQAKLQEIQPDCIVHFW